MANSTIKNNSPSAIGEAVDLTPYTSSTNYYTIPSDGLLTVDVAGGSTGNNVTMNIDGINLIAVAGSSAQVTQTLSIPVYKGMKVYTRFNIGNGNYARYRPFIY